MKQKELYEKDGQVMGAVGSTVNLIVGVGVAVMVLIFVGVLGGQAYTITEPQLDALTSTITGESLVLGLNNTEVFLANNDILNNTLEFYNSTETFNQDMFSVDLLTGGVTPTNITLENSTILANYTEGEAAAQSSIKNAIISGFSALEQTGDYLPLIVLAVIIFLILVLVLGFTTLGNAGGGKGRAGSVL